MPSRGLRTLPNGLGTARSPATLIRTYRVRGGLGTVFLHFPRFPPIPPIWTGHVLYLVPDYSTRERKQRTQADNQVRCCARVPSVRDGATPPCAPRARTRDPPARARALPRVVVRGLALVQTHVSHSIMCDPASVFCLCSPLLVTTTRALPPLRLPRDAPARMRALPPPRVVVREGPTLVQPMCRIPSCAPHICLF